jgi:type I restriction enzyme, S subunit
MSTKAQQVREQESTTGESELPEGWTSVRVSEVFDCWGGMTPPTSNRAYWGGTIPWLSSKDIKSPRIESGADFITKKAIEETRLRLCPKGSVVTVVRSGILANSFPVAVTEAPVTINQDLKAFWCAEPALNEWLAVHLRALEPQILAENRKDGTTVQSIRVDQLKDVALRIPPIAEEKRITATIQALVHRIRASEDHLEKCSVIIKGFRQAVLAAACSGKLTEDWRSANNSLAEDGRLLVEQILNAKTALQFSKSRKSVPLSEVNPHEVVWELPSTWCYARLRDVTQVVADIDHKMPKAVEKGVKFLSAKDLLDDGTLNLTRDVKHISEADFARLSRKARPQRDDIVYSRIGARLGKARLVETDERFLVSYSCCIIRPLIIIPKYLVRFLDSAVVLSRAQEEAKSIGVPDLGLEEIKRFPVPVPPLMEQQEIVRRVEALFKLADTIEKRVAAASIRAERLTQAVLAKAFRGELVPTEAALARREGREYEPASVLLERIKAERKTLGNPKNKRA